MKKFLIQLIIFIIPVGMILVSMEVYLRQNNIYRAKKTFLDNNKQDIEALILGPSYSWRSINPEFLDTKTASLAHEASAINTNMMLFDKYAPQLPKLKYVIFDLSIGFLDTHNEENWESKHLFNIYYDIKSSNNNLEDYFLLSSNFKYYTKLCLSYITDPDNIPAFNDSGFIYKLSKQEDIFRIHEYNSERLKQADVLYRRLDYQNTINEENYHSNIDLLKGLITYCRENKINLIFISPPKSYLNNEKISTEAITRRQKFIDDITPDPYISFWNYENFHEQDINLFYDDTHLNPKGAELFTKTLNRKLDNYLINRNRAEMQSEF
ncbi:hypothetical protein IFO69_08270 [Echinicola sp. CAU 1574]|uniref:SGNH/GDSL hydrolase family protein n=1 Tax=Echinicola arenosa TaxID=2774144 RepID=A0ABR9AK91_9BACT|nr:hypothetical protein [Echinicola arenosa]MBD8488736.1 hypothetical protein [Echinicola arenosa]